METSEKEHIKLLEAKRRVKEIKGFYIHFSIYLFINFIVFLQYLLKVGDNANLEYGVNFYTAVLWGIVILIHAGSIFIPMFTKWESRKTREFMNAEKENHGRSSI